MRRERGSFKRWLPAILCVGLTLLFIGGVSFAYYLHPPQNACFAFEQFDWDGQYCYATCDTGSECEALDQKYADVDVQRPSDKKRDYFGFYTYVIEAPPGGFAPSDSAVYTTYEINDGELGKTVYASSTAETRLHDVHTWHLISPLIPTLAARKISQFTAYDDAVGAAGAFAAPVDESARTWEISFNEIGFYTDKQTVFNRGNAIHTIVHEIGHVITLGSSLEQPSGKPQAVFKDQIIQDEAACPTFKTYEMCIKADSYVDRYAKQFWPRSYKDGGDVPAPYTADAFVSSYAATNLAEDMAESWTAFVLLDKPAGDTTADKKVLFFYRYSEFVAARAQILKQIGHVH